MKLAILDSQPETLKEDLTDQNIAYWKDKLKGASLLQLPTDFPRSAAGRTTKSSLSFTLDERLTEQLLVLTKGYETTLFTTLLASLNSILYRYSTQNEICISAVIPARGLKMAEDTFDHENIMPLRSNVDGEASFITVLQQLKTTVLDAVKHPVFIDKLLSEMTPEKSHDSGALLQVVFALNSRSEIKTFRNYITGSELAFMLTVTENALEGEIEYNAGLYKKETIERMVEHYRQLLYSIVQDPDQKTGALPMLTDEEKKAPPGI